MPIADPYSAAPTTPKKPKVSTPAPDYPMATKLSPDALQGFLDQGYVDYGDGTLIPPMDKTDMGMGQPNAYDMSGTSASGGPAGMQTDVRSDIFKNLYKLGRQSGNPSLMTMAQPPSADADPLAFMQQTPDLPGFPKTTQNLRQMPSLPPSPQAPDYTQAGVGQTPGADMMRRRFPKATALLAGAKNAPAMRRRGQ